LKISLERKGYEVAVKWPSDWELVSCHLVEFCMVGCEDSISAREAKESSQLEAVAREQLLKIIQVGEELVCIDL
jgi:hypothetical protein